MPNINNLGAVFPNLHVSAGYVSSRTLRGAWASVVLQFTKEASCRAGPHLLLLRQRVCLL